MNMFIPITKVDLKNRQVWGRATQEIKDGHGEIMDFESSVPYFKKWSDDAQARSGGKSLGNLREMHQPIAAGKLIAIDFNESEKAIDIGTYVSDEGSWRKVLDGTLTGFSIGGDYAKRWNDQSNYSLMRFTAAPAEISLVDVPAVPTATFQVIKVDGSTEMRKVGDPINVQVVIDKAEGLIEPLEKDHEGAPGIPAEDVPIEMGVTDGSNPPDEAVPQEVLSGYEITEVAADGSGRPTGEDERVQELAVNADTGTPELPPPPTPNRTAAEWAEPIEKLQSTLQLVVEKLNALDDEKQVRKSALLAELQARSSRVGIARREGEPLTPLDGNSDQWQQYADPVNWKFPLTKRENASEAIAMYNSGKHRSAYSATEWNVVGRRITRLASDLYGELYKFNPTSKRVEKVQKEIKMSKLQKDADVAAVLHELSAQLSNAVDMIGNNPEAAKDLLVQAMGAIDVASDVAPANPEVPSTHTPALAASESTPASASPAMSMAASSPASPTAPAVETTQETTPSSASFDKNADAIMKALATMQEQINALAKKQEVAAEAQLPLGDLNALLKGLNNAPAEVNTNQELIAAMTAGDLAKAFSLAGQDSKTLFEQVNDAAVRQIYENGINVSKFMFLPTEAADLGIKQ